MVHIGIILFLLPVASAVNFKSCIQEVQNGTWGSVGGADNRGRPVSDISKATAITYDLCMIACGTTSEPFAWPIFSQQFSSWLLPWLALVSQLPFGANDKLDNLVSVLLTVGSPTLAAYSLALTVLNGRWIARHFAAYRYPNIKYAVQILSSLQQSPLMVTKSGSLLSSLVVLPENDEWWSELVTWLDFTHTWSVSAVTSIAWVIIAYVFTLIDSFTGDPTGSINSNGQGVGSLWLWLLPIVIGWLQISPKCDSARLRQAIERANKIAYMATPFGAPVLASSVSMQYAIALTPPSDDLLRCDELCTSPIYNYARFLPWVQAVEDVCDVFIAASNNAHRHISVVPQLDWESTDKVPGPSHRNRMGNLTQVDAYCVPVGEPATTRANRWTHGIWTRFFIASVLALSLQWGTTGAAVVVSWFTPTKGLGCRSGGYVLYGVLSTISWMILVLSSFLSHYSATAPDKSASASVAGQTSIVLRRLGKIVASFNAVWIIVTCMFQFSNFYDRCFCNSSVFGLGAKSFDVIILNHEDIVSMKGAWIGGAFLAAATVVISVIFINLFINPELPD